MQLPPGPRLGIRDGLEYIRAPAAFYRRMAADFGDPFTLRTPAGTVVMTGHPEGVRAIFTLDPSAVRTWNPGMVAAFVGDRSIFITEGADHARDRRIIGPAFRGARLSAYPHAFARCADEECVRALARGTAVHDLARDISLRTIVRTILGITDRDRTGVVMGVVRTLMERITPLTVLFPQLRRNLFGIGPWDRYRRARRRFDAVVSQEIAGAPNDESVLGMLLRARDDGEPLDDSAIRDILLTLLLAGHETSAITLVWAVHAVSTHPAVRRRLVDEIAGLDVDGLVTAPYLDAVCNETLRLHPVVPELTRQLATELELRGHLLPPGIAVGVCAPLAHMRPETFADPESFDPDRFLGRKYASFEFFPFGGGLRHCVGASFAVRQLKVVLGRLLAHGIDVMPGPPLGTRRRNLTLGPDREVRAVFRPALAFSS